MKGLFITFEGPDGSGKTSVATAVCEKLSQMGYDVIHINLSSEFSACYQNAMRVFRDVIK